MSKIGAKPIIITNGVSLKQEGSEIVVRGPLGEKRISLPDVLSLEIGVSEIRVKRLDESSFSNALHGTVARLLANAIKGVVEAFSKSLEVVGTGYRASMEGETLVLNIGFSHPVRVIPPSGIKIEVLENKVKVSGLDKELVGNMAAKIRKLKKPDAYKGKGIRYWGEKLKLKPGKAVAKAGATGTK